MHIQELPDLIRQGGWEVGTRTSNGCEMVYTRITRATVVEGRTIYFMTEEDGVEGCAAVVSSFPGMIIVANEFRVLIKAKRFIKRVWSKREGGGWHEVAILGKTLLKLRHAARHAAHKAAVKQRMAERATITTTAGA